MVKYREGGGVVRFTDGCAMPIEGIGNLPMSFWSGKNWVKVMLLLGYNLLSLKMIVWMLGRALKLTREHLAVAPCTRRVTQFLYY